MLPRLRMRLTGLSYEANAAELGALKRYAGIEDVTDFTAQVRISPLTGGKYRASGTLRASVVQASVVNLEPVPSSIEESSLWTIGPPRQSETGMWTPRSMAICPSLSTADAYRWERCSRNFSRWHSIHIPAIRTTKLDWTPPRTGLEPRSFCKLARLKPDAPPDKE